MNGAMFSSPGAFASFLTATIGELHHAKHAALEKAAKLVETEAKEVIGTYSYGWPQLAKSTQQDRTRRGFSANEPLLRSGELRNSINHEVSDNRAIVGSNLDAAVYAESGTSKEPPRSFLLGAAMHKGNEVAEIVGEHVHGHLIGRSNPLTGGKL